MDFVHIDHQCIRAKAMIIALDETDTHHAVSFNKPTLEDRLGYHRLIGGTVEFGETTRDAIAREIREELDPEIHVLVYLGVPENIFDFNEEPCHELVAVYTGRLDPQPPTVGATLTESDGSVQSVTWRRIEGAHDPIPLYPAGAEKYVRQAVLLSRSVR